MNSLIGRCSSVAARAAFLLGIVCVMGGASFRAQNTVRVKDGQRGESSAAELSRSFRAVLVGRVVGPDGRPARGVAVVSSAGGASVTDAAGAFDLAIEVPLEAECVDVTATLDGRAGAASLVASARIVPAALAPITPVGTLLLVDTPTCQARWLPTLGAQPGTNGPIQAFAVFDDGGGPALYAGGDFTAAGAAAANGVARWDGTSWSALGSGVNGAVLALAVFDDGNGPALYVGGNFTSAGGVPAVDLARWDGSWSSVGSGTAGPVGYPPSVLAFAVFDDGSGPALYAGGKFTSVDGVSAQGIARWNGSSWSAVGGGIDGFVHALAVYDGGGGPALHAGGAFAQAGGVSAGNIARWDGSTWAPLGSGVTNDVYALAVFDDGGGSELYVGGRFGTAGGVDARRIAKWDGSSWAALGSVFGPSFDASVFALTVFDAGGGPALYAGGDFDQVGGIVANRTARWNGSGWAALGDGMDGDPGLPGTIVWSVHALAVFDDGGGALLHAGGYFTSADGLAVNQIATWDGERWKALDRGRNGPIHALAIFDDGGGPALYAAGEFTSCVARWSSSGWAALGEGITGGIFAWGFTPPSVHALAVFDDGGGPALYAGGSFTTAGGNPADRIAKWDGSSWSALAGSLNGRILSLLAFDDGSGPALYAGGEFTTAGGVTVDRIARWDGSSWSALGSGISGGIEPPPSVMALAVYDDGTGPALYAGGTFLSAGGVTARRVARWNGSTWSALGDGLRPPGAVVSALTVHDDGNGPALYAGGWFDTAGGLPASNIARWDGSAWSALGSGTDSAVSALTVQDDGNGPALYAGGGFAIAGGVAANDLARWDGASWSAVASGTQLDDVLALTSFDDGDGAALFPAGSFFSTPTGDSYLARWGCTRKVRQAQW